MLVTWTVLCLLQGGRPNFEDASPPIAIIASTDEPSASTREIVASTNSSHFVPRVEVVEAVEANPHTLRGWPVLPALWDAAGVR